MIAAIIAVALVVLLSIGIFLYYKKCFSKSEDPSKVDGNQIPNTSASVIGSSSKLEDVFEDQYHPKSNALDLVMHADINFRKGSNDVVQEVTVEDEASDVCSPDKHQETEEGGAGYLHTKAGEGKMKDDTPLHDSDLDPKAMLDFKS